jgi:hypothetical protein
MLVGRSTVTRGATGRRFRPIGRDYRAVFQGTQPFVDTYAVGFARPDRWSRDEPAHHSHPWHAVEAHRPPSELDGEIELAVCGAIVQIWGTQKWERVGAGRTACPRCQEVTAVTKTLTPSR